MNPDMKPCFFKVSEDREIEDREMEDRNKERERETNREKKGE